MYKLASCCLLFIGFLNPLLSLPIIDSREVSLQLSAPDEDAKLTWDEPERASLLQILPEMLGAERGDGLRKADSRTHIFNPRGNLRKFQDFSGQDPNVLLSRLLARTKKQYKKRGTISECFWKYCV
ncbi:PREDICTED: urotensin-2 [Galeopterus variegatus]|uniref:Urotensin-2 n=1 Tax=Galeopterus variegatus TaxID=482537 RepID=A0ABM0QJE1_GALVR|nr:PREDICTED: urotensin-2 [Galeopterus variegatus]